MAGESTSEVEVSSSVVKTTQSLMIHHHPRLMWSNLMVQTIVVLWRCEVLDT